VRKRIILSKNQGHHWWSSLPLLIQQQILVVLIVAQLVQALRMQIAIQALVDPFEVSLPLLLEYLLLFVHIKKDLLRLFSRLSRKQFRTQRSQDLSILDTIRLLGC
jgi:hypothetical protein